MEIGKNLSTMLFIKIRKFRIVKFPTQKFYITKTRFELRKNLLLNNCWKRVFRQFFGYIFFLLKNKKYFFYKEGGERLKLREKFQMKIVFQSSRNFSPPLIYQWKLLRTNEEYIEPFFYVITW